MSLSSHNSIISLISIILGVIESGRNHRKTHMVIRLLQQLLLLLLLLKLLLEIGLLIMNSIMILWVFIVKLFVLECMAIILIELYIKY